MWLVAQTEPKKEQFVGDNIERQGYEYYLPKFREGSKTRLLFPRYVFCRVEGSWRFLTGTFGVISIIAFGERPGVISDGVIAALRAREDEFGFVILPDKTLEAPPLIKGQRILLRSGPFMGYIGLYDGQTSRDRERVLLELLGRKLVVRVNRDDIEVEG